MYIVSGIGIGAATFKADMTRPSRARTGRDFKPCHQLFPNNLLFPIEHKVFGCTYFIRDVHPRVSKLDAKSLKCKTREKSIFSEKWQNGKLPK